MRSAPQPNGPDPDAFVAFCAGALPQVYGYLVARCGDPTVAEDLTSETFMAAVSAHRRAPVDGLSVGWLIVVARRRLVDHWRREEREARRLRRLECDVVEAVDDDPWDASIDQAVGLAALARLGPHHRAVLTLRYVDGLSVAEVAAELGRGTQATGALLQRARLALRRAYEEGRAHV